MDALLVAQRRVSPGVPVGTVDGHVVRVPGSCYMDDAVWYAETAEEMKRRVWVHHVFCQYHGVKLNLSKSTYTYVPPRGGKSATPPPPPEIGGIATKVGHPEGYFKYLGVCTNVGGSVKHEVGRLASEVHRIYDAIERKELSPEEAKYVINTVIAGKLQYSMQTVGLPRAFLQRVDDRSARVMKLKSGIGVNGPRYLVFLRCDQMGLGVTSFVDMQDAIMITEQVIRLNSAGLAGRVSRARLMMEKERSGVLSCPFDRLAFEEMGLHRFGQGLVRYTQRCLQLRGMEIRTSDIEVHRRCLDSVHMNMVLRRSHSLDWSLLSQRLAGKVWVRDWARRVGDEWEMKGYDQMVHEGNAQPGTPSQIYCMVRHLLTGGTDEGVRSGELLPEYCWSEEADRAHLEGVMREVEGEV
jgi:hypothetical protein